jgi:hypothetical protein
MNSEVPSSTAVVIQVATVTGCRVVVHFELLILFLDRAIRPTRNKICMDWGSI